MKQLLSTLQKITIIIILIFSFYSCEEEIKDDIATLKGIYINGSLINDFSSQILNYDLTFDYGENLPDITVETSYPEALIDITLPSEIPGKAIIEVIAKDGVTTTIYKINFFETPPSKDASLKSILINGLKLEDFTIEQTVYQIELPDGTTEIPLIGVFTNDNNAIATITQTDKLPGVTTITVTAQDTSITKKYTINFTVKVGVITINKFLTSIVWEAILLEIPERDYSTEIADQLFFHSDDTFVWLSIKNTLEGTWALNQDGIQITININENESLILYDLAISKESLFFKYDLQEENSSYVVHITCRQYTGSCNS